MAKRKKGKSKGVLGQQRRHYPHEKRYTWLTVLLDSYAISDKEWRKDVARQEKIRGEKVACHKGCFACCLRYNVPITTLEFQGISWYISEIMDAKTQEKLKPRLQNAQNSLECPMLIDGICSIYPVRPLACREFFVYGTPCDEGEDPWRTRREDVHPPNPAIAKKVAMRFLDDDSYQLNTIEEKERAFENGIMGQNRSMHELDWAALIPTIELFAAKRSTI